MADGYYTDGTVSSSGATITGVGTAWEIDGIRPGDRFGTDADGLAVRIATVDSDTQITLEAPWPGAALSGDAYYIEYLPDGSRLTAKLQELLTAIGDSGNVDALAGLPGAADKLPYFTGAGAMALADFTADARDLLTRWTRATNANPSRLDLSEDTDNGTNKVSLTVPSSLTGDRTVTLPDADMTFSAAFAAFLNTPSSANFAALLTNETGTSTVVFSDSPSLTTKANFASGFVLDFASGDVTLTHASNALTLAGGNLYLPAAVAVFGSATAGTSGAGGTPSLQGIGATGARAASLFQNTGASDGYTIFNRAGVGDVGSIVGNGGSGVTYNTTSDYRRKRNVEPLADAWDRLAAVLPRAFVWTTDEVADRGFIAHEFAEVYPRSVTGEKDAVNDKGEPIYQSMQASSSEVMADVIAALQDIKARLDAAGL